MCSTKNKNWEELFPRRHAESKSMKMQSSVSDSPFRPTAFHLSVIPHSVTISVRKKNHLPMVLQTEFARQKKRFPLEIYRRIFMPSVISWFTNGYKPSVNLSVSVWNTDRIYPSVNSSVSVAATVKCWRIKSFGKAVCEWLKYRPDISVYKGVGECYCQIPTDSFRR